MTRSSWTTRSHAFAGCIQSGTGFPDGRALGKSVPEFGFGMGCSFRLRGLAENASRNLQSEWDEVSQRSHKRKLHPTPNANCGTRFPDAKKPHDVAFNLYICCGYPPHDKPRSNNRASVRAAEHKVHREFRAQRRPLNVASFAQDCPGREPYMPPPGQTFQL